MADDEEDGIGSALSERFGGGSQDTETEATSETGENAGKESTGQNSKKEDQQRGEEATESGRSSSREEGGAVRDRTNYTIYVSEGVRADLDERFRRFNAERTLEGKPEVQKHDHFIEAVLRAGLDHEKLDEFVDREFQLEE